MQSFMSTGCHYFLFMQYVQQQLYGCILLATFFPAVHNHVRTDLLPNLGFQPTSYTRNSSIHSDPIPLFNLRHMTLH